MVGKRHDDYHELCTIFQTVSLHDELEFWADDKITLTCNKINIPIDEGNLIIKAARILTEKFKIKKGAKIHLQKKNSRTGRIGRRFFKCGGCTYWV